MSRPKSNENIQVYVRVRPMNSRERGIRSMEAVLQAPPKEIHVQSAFDSKVKKFTFDKTFGPDSLQVDVYNSVVAPMIQEVLAGYNCTVFAYGQTGTGKTYTMIGDEHLEDKTSCEEDNMAGIIPRALNQLFDELRLLELEFSMRVSYLELYNEELCDLLSTDDLTKIRIYDDASKKGSVIIQGLEEIPVHNKSDVYRLLATGQQRRKTATTLMNAQSSRSHTVFSILVHIKENGTDGEEMLKIGKLNLVDLAGSENISKAGNEKGIRSRETVNINQSLLTLGRVITALVERTPHIPYRESKLTRILQESLGGKTKTSIIATVSPGHKDLEETLSTLDYAHRAKNIQNKPEINQRLTKKTVLKEYTEEIDRLKRELVATRDKNGVYLPEDTYDELQNKLEAQTKELNEKFQYVKALKDECTSKTKLFNEVSLNLVKTTQELKNKSSSLIEKEKLLSKAKTVISTTSKEFRETKYVLEKHRETEIQLTNQAKEIIGVAELASNDSLSLHDAIERREQVEKNISNACNQFSIKMNTLLENINTNVDHFNKKFSNQTQMIVHEINANNDKNNEFTSSFVEMLNEFSTLNSSQISEIRERIATVCCTSKIATTDFIVYLLNKLTEIETKEVEHEKAINGKLQRLYDAILAQHQHQIDNNRTIIAITNENKRNEIEFLQKLSTDFNILADEIHKNYNSNVNRLNGTVANNEEIANKQLENLTLVENLIAQMKSAALSLQSNNLELVGLSSTMSTERDVIKTNFDRNTNEMKKMEEDLLRNDKIDQNVCENNLKLNETKEECIRMVSENQRSNVEHAQLTHDQLIELRTTAETHSTTTGEYLSNELGQLNSDHENLTSKIIKFANNCVSDVTAENKRNQRSHVMFNSYHETLTASQTEGVKTFKTDVDTIRNEVETFRTHEVKTYANTGLTPMKKTYKIRKELVATSPHERLRQRFREDHDNSVLDVSLTISEQPSICESFTEGLSNMNILMSSAVHSDSVDVIESSPEDYSTANDITIENTLSSSQSSPNDSFDLKTRDCGTEQGATSLPILTNSNVNYTNRYMDREPLYVKNRIDVTEENLNEIEDKENNF